VRPRNHPTPEGEKREGGIVGVAKKGKKARKEKKT
jgi:hypothetical protein